MESDYYLDLDINTEVGRKAIMHVSWLWDMITPIVKSIAIAEFVHGYKHGREDAKDEQQRTPSD